MNDIFKEGELDKTISKASRPPQYYNLDVIISVGYRVKSKLFKLNKQKCQAFLKMSQKFKNISTV